MFQELVQTLPLDKAVYVEGSTVNQIAFHAGQSANNFLRVHVLGKTFDRNKPAEYGEQHTLEEINKSLDMALEACEMVEKENPNMNQKLANPIEMNDGGFTLITKNDALTFSLAHSAEHYGELNQVKRELESSKS